MAAGRFIERWREDEVMMDVSKRIGVPNSREDFVRHTHARVQTHIRKTFLLGGGGGE